MNEINQDPILFAQENEVDRLSALLTISAEFVENNMLTPDTMWDQCDEGRFWNDEVIDKFNEFVDALPPEQLFEIIWTAPEETEPEWPNHAHFHASGETPREVVRHLAKSLLAGKIDRLVESTQEA